MEIDSSVFRCKSTLYEVKHIRQKYEEPDDDERSEDEKESKSEKVESRVEGRQTRNLTINTQALQFIQF